MESLTEQGRLEQNMDHGVPTGKEGYGLSDRGNLLTQVASRSNSGSKVASQPVEDSAPSTTVAIGNTGSGAPKLGSVRISVFLVNKLVLN